MNFSTDRTFKPIKMNEVIVGTYEGYLLGYSLSNNNEDKMVQNFATHSHINSVKCVDIAGRFLASGGSDDKVVIIDLKTRKEHTVLMHHNGTINTVRFTNNGTHLITGSSDGSIVMTRAGNWQIEKIWKKAHGGAPVNCIIVHPSDKLALSIGGDKTLRTWNLVKGRPAFTMNLSSKGVNFPTELYFAPDGDLFCLISDQTVDIWSIKKGGIEKRITCNSKPTCASWYLEDKLFIGLENGNILNMSVADSQAITCPAHKERVKCLYVSNKTMYSASSSGEIKIWNLSEDDKINVNYSISTGTRITCITLNHNDFGKLKEEIDIQHNDSNELVKQDKINSKEAGSLKALKRSSGPFVFIEYEKDDEEKKLNEDVAKDCPISKKKKGKNKKKSFSPKENKDQEVKNNIKSSKKKKTNKRNNAPQKSNEDAKIMNPSKKRKI